MNVLDQDGLQKLVSDINSRAVQSMSVDGTALKYTRMDGSTGSIDISGAVIAAASASSNNGYVKFQNGILIQYGYTVDMQMQSFPLSFSTAPNIVTTHLMGNESGNAHYNGGYTTSSTYYIKNESSDSSYYSFWIAAGV